MKYVRQATLGDLSEISSIISSIFEDAKKFCQTTVLRNGKTVRRRLKVMTKIISESIPENGKTGLMIILFIVWPSRASIKDCI